MNDDGRHPLDPLASADAPELDAATRARLESGLRVQHAAQRSTGARRPLPRWAALVPVVALVLLATVTLVLRDEAAVAALELSGARDVTITLPDGEVVLDPADGFALIDGAVVVVGASGSATIDDIALAPGAVVTVRDGQLVSDVVATTTTTATDRALPPDDGVPPIDEPPTDRPPTTTTAPGPATTTTVRDDPSRPDDRPHPPVTTEGPVDPPVDTVVPPVDSPPVDPPADRGTEISLALRVGRVDGGVRVAWNVERADIEGWRVVVMRTTDESDPVDASTGTVVGEGRRGEVVDRRTDLPDPLPELRYRLIVLDAEGGAVARGPVQTLTPPGS